MTAKATFGFVALALLGCVSSTVSLPPTPAPAAQAPDPMPRPSPNAPQPPASSPTPAPTPGTATVRIAAGATSAYTDPEGRVWSADSDFTGGVTYVNTSPVAIAGTDAAPLYNSERYGQANNAAASFAYSIAVPNGAYTVRLGFAELYATGAGQRLFDVSLNGQKVLTAFDIYAAAGAGNTAVVRPFSVVVSDGKVQLSFDPGGVQNPKINTIEIVPATVADDG